ncbi:hypothetical protein COCMIDRAFT_99224 [Bipolaris oryzae ATCC 44560]|uniref:Protein kinase domain-containing protein n=1 Tax=Bipolaris oryzae ATCC 44560 TaxID=930090 RepID=W6Z8Z6_COCMI|nr:uncharacterized protein COCMIDRAFT_99224 [Bipolaris oryzae ATCC 44560]EUC44024.1 hypothetical protein COCMIDRAFT_99224 [Bipolaris oryzae ATCC 44560]
MSSRTLTNVVNDQTVALNALIYGYAGHSLVTPQHALQQIWWTEERINERVTNDFVTSRLQPQERERLTQPVGFGDLSDDTYIEWIMEKARRLFLILVEIGEADRIFAVVDKSWDDDDLPLGMEDIEQLSLSNRRDNHANARFYHTQFTFLLRELRQGVHIDYAQNEEVPIESVMTLPVAVSLQAWSRIHLPKKPKEIYMRRKFPLGNAEDPEAFHQDFILDVESARMVEHEHLAPVWASYTAKGSGYIVSNFVGHHTLRTFIDHRNPAQYQKLPKPERRWLVLNWLHCLADTIATLHQNGFCHSAIRPSRILVDEQNAIAFSDIGSLETFQKDKKPDAMDAYIYDAPEAHASSEPVDLPSSVTAPTLSKDRHASIASKSSSGSSNSSGSHRQKLTKSPTTDFSGFNFGFKKSEPKPQHRTQGQETEKADVFSLGCVFLEILTFLLKKKSHDFTKHRTSKQRINTGGKNSRTDSSYHKNLDKVETWMAVLEKASRESDDEAFGTVSDILALIRTMLSKNPMLRPTARDVRDELFEIFSCTSMPNIHCGAHRHDVGVASSSRSDRDRSSSIASLRTVSTISSTYSDVDTIRSGTTQVNSILNYYSDRATLSGIKEDDSVSLETIDTPAISLNNDSFHALCGPGPIVAQSAEIPEPLRSLGYATSPASPTVPLSPILPASPTSPTSPTGPSSLLSARSPSPSKQNTTTVKVKPWNKPFLLLP